VTTGKAARSSVETRGCSRFRPASVAAIAMCSDRYREKRSPWAPQLFGPRAGANPRNSVHHATESKETVLPEKNSREKSGPSKKRKSTPGSTGDNDQANARAHYTSTARLLNSIQCCRNWSSRDGASPTFPGISVVIPRVAPYVARSTLPRRNDLRTWFRAAGPHQRVRSRRSTMEQQLAERGVPKRFGTKHNAKSYQRPG